MAIGLALQFAPWLVNWFGKVPGDINYESGNMRMFIPIISTLVINVVLSFLLYLGRRSQVAIQR